MRITVGKTLFTATLYDNATAKAFQSLLPLRLDMIELNGNEKYADLPCSLPTRTAHPGTIQNGDLMLYGSSSLVMFYETFRTAYHYTKIGRIDDPAGLAKALGPGNVSITFELQ
jgi:hypothetical protein